MPARVFSGSPARAWKILAHSGWGARMSASSSARERLGFLDVARGVAALLVVAEHGLRDCLPGYIAWTRDHVDLGYIGVLLFLLVSGFIIPVSLDQGGSNARFWLRRLF